MELQISVTKVKYHTWKLMSDLLYTENVYIEKLSMNTSWVRNSDLILYFKFGLCHTYHISMINTCSSSNQKIYYAKVTMLCSHVNGSSVYLQMKGNFWVLSLMRLTTEMKITQGRIITTLTIALGKIHHRTFKIMMEVTQTDSWVYWHKILQIARIQ